MFRLAEKSNEKRLDSAGRSVDVESAAVATAERVGTLPGAGEADDRPGAKLSHWERTPDGKALLNVPRPAIEMLVERLPQHKTKRYRRRSLDAITHIVVHQSGVAANIALADIAQYHVDELDWPGVGYHFYILPDGTIQQCNALETVSYQAGPANPYSVGICFAGKFDQFVPTAAQIDAGARLIVWLLHTLALPVENVVGHNDLPFFQGKIPCPGQQWRQGLHWRKQLLTAMAEVRENLLARASGKKIDHYLLFWCQGEEWDRRNWLNAENYIARYHPTAGFSLNGALLADRVTIIGPTWKISEEVEQRLQAAGVKVRRLAGKDSGEIKKSLDALVEKGDPFLLS